MASIDDFLDHRWADAKEKLREMDPEFVHKLEFAVRLQAVRLEPPWKVDVDMPPSQGLSTQWHRLLEACLESRIRVSNVQVAAHHLTADTTRDLPSNEAGSRILYHLRSWFIHVGALAESTKDLITKTTDVYIADAVKRAKLARRHRASVYRRVTQHINSQRNNYLHERNRSWASAITEEKLWEKLISGGMTPARYLADFGYPGFAADAVEGKYDGFIGETRKVLASAGSILQGLESDLTTTD